jgi:putative alpha-1,2-mannosidase
LHIIIENFRLKADIYGVSMNNELIMKKKIMMSLAVLMATCLLFGFSPEKGQVSDSLVDNVDLRIGTSNDGSNCLIGPQLPFGSINPAPQTPNGNMAGYDPAQPISRSYFSIEPV